MSNDRVKRLIHRACYRGIKEMDLILGGFAKAHADDLNETEISLFEALLSEKDHDIYDWICGVTRVPAAYESDLFNRICEFKPDF